MKTLFLAIVLAALFAVSVADVELRILPHVCHLPKRVGHCKAIIPQWWYNARAKECQLFHYSGCRGNDNRFHSKAACERKCKPRKIDICKLPADSGPCKALGYRWYFNHHTGKCEQFQYGGCGGNKNNFATRAECQKACRKDCKLVRCFADPCKVKKCPRHPHARCIANYCNGCNADFVDRLGKLIDCGTDDCAKRSESCDNPEYYDRFPGHKKHLKECCHGLQCCACGPPVRPHGYVPPQFGTCRRRCNCFKG